MIEGKYEEKAYFYFKIRWPSADKTLKHFFLRKENIKFSTEQNRNDD